jgi:hypothetical protein
VMLSRAKRKSSRDFRFSVAAALCAF